MPNKKNLRERAREMARRVMPRHFERHTTTYSTSSTHPTSHSNIRAAQPGHLFSTAALYHTPPGPAKSTRINCIQYSHAANVYTCHPPLDMESLMLPTIDAIDLRHCWSSILLILLLRSIHLDLRLTLRLLCSWLSLIHI